MQAGLAWAGVNRTGYRLDIRGKGGICLRQSVLKWRPGRPPIRGEPRNIQELARRPVRLGRVENELTAIVDHPSDEPRDLGDRDVLSRADVERYLAGVVFENENTGVRQVVHKQEFAPRRSGTPHSD